MCVCQNRFPMADENGGVQMRQEAAAHAVRIAASFAASIKEASMSKGGRKEHLKKIAEFKAFVQQSEHPAKSTILSQDSRWKHGVDLDVLGKAPELMEEFFISLKPERKGTGVKVTVDGEVKMLKGLPALKKYRASMTFLFTENCVEPSLEYQLVMTRFFKGLGNIDASDTSKPKEKASGKEPLAHPLYCDILKSYAYKSCCFMMLFFITTWNLICRGKQTSEIKLSQLAVVNDSITVEFAGTKTDTDGQTSNTKEPRHCYANPHNWRTCFFTWLGIYFLCNPTLHSSCMQDGDADVKLFPANDAKSTFSKGLQRDKGTFLKQVFESYGSTAASKSGVHSVRKGGATCVASASTNGPSMVSICQRCCWAIGGVLDRCSASVP